MRIVASGDLDEYAVERLVRAGAPIDVFGVGTEMITSRDAPALSLVYKLVALDGAGRIKLSPGKKTYPLGKQVYRISDAAGKFVRDHVTAEDEAFDGDPLLVPVVRGGKLAAPLPTLGRDSSAVSPNNSPRCLRSFCRTTRRQITRLTYSDRLEAEAARLGVK